MASVLTSDFQKIIAPAADSIEKLRGIDLDRVLTNAYDNFPASLTEFVGWLEAERPDLKARIARTIDDLIADGIWPQPGNQF
jgi:hypothetical protein